MLEAMVGRLVLASSQVVVDVQLPVCTLLGCARDDIVTSCEIGSWLIDAGTSTSRYLAQPDLRCVPPQFINLIYLNARALRRIPRRQHPRLLLVAGQPSAQVAVR